MTAETSTGQDPVTAETATVISELVGRVDELYKELLAAYDREESLVRQIGLFQEENSSGVVEYSAGANADADLQRSLAWAESQNADFRLELASMRIEVAKMQAELRANGSNHIGEDPPDDARHQDRAHSKVRRQYRQLCRRLVGLVQPK